MDRQRQFETLLMESSRGLKHLALRLTKNPSEADDLFQDSCVRAWRKFDNFEMGTSFFAWFKCIQYNLFLNSIHKAKRQGDKNKLLARDLESYPMAAPPLSPEKALQYKEGFSEVVLEAFTKTKQCFHPVLLLTAQGNQYSETAEELNIPIGTVMSQLCRARKNFAPLLKNHYNTFKQVECRH